MATLIRPKRWGLQKPPPGTQINPGHPLASGLVAALALNEGGGAPRNLVSGALGTRNGASTNWVGSPDGPALSFTPADSDYVSTTATAATPASIVGTLLARVLVTLTTKGMYIKWGGTSRGIGFGIGSGTVDSNGSTLLGLNENVAWVSSGFTLTAGWHTIAWSVPPGGASVFFVDGVQVGTGSVGGSAAGTNEVDIGGYTASSRYSTSTISLAQVWTRALSQTEVRWLYVEPYAFMQPQSPQRRYWAFVPAGGLANVWSGSAWVQKPAMVWNGSAWVQKPVEVWTGSAWKASS